MAGETSAPSTLPKYHMAKNWHQEQWFWKEALRHYYLKSKMIAKPLSFFWWVLTPLGCSCHETSPHSHVINQKVGPKTSAKEGAMSPGVKKTGEPRYFRPFIGAVYVTPSMRIARKWRWLNPSRGYAACLAAELFFTIQILPSKINIATWVDQLLIGGGHPTLKREFLWVNKYK